MNNPDVLVIPNGSSYCYLNNAIQTIYYTPILIKYMNLLKIMNINNEMSNLLLKLFSFSNNQDILIDSVYRNNIFLELRKHYPTFSENVQCDSFESLLCIINLLRKNYKSNCYFFTEFSYLKDKNNVRKFVQIRARKNLNLQDYFNSTKRIFIKKPKVLLISIEKNNISIKLSPELKINCFNKDSNIEDLFNMHSDNRDSFNRDSNKQSDNRDSFNKDSFSRDFYNRDSFNIDSDNRDLFNKHNNTRDSFNKAYHNKPHYNKLYHNKPYYDKSSNQSNLLYKSKIYKLVSAVCYKSFSILSGHYYGIYFDIQNNCWIYYNYNNVNVFSLKDYSNNEYNNFLKYIFDHIENNCSYLVYYKIN